MKSVALKRLKNKGMRLLTTPASYPECHRFESYLSHIRKTPYRIRYGAFFMPSAQAQKDT